MKILKADTRRVVEAIGPFCIVEVPGGFVAENLDVEPPLKLTGVVSFDEARLAVCDALERYARGLSLSFQKRVDSSAVVS